MVETTRRVIETWSRSGRGKEAAWHAAYFLRGNLLSRRTTASNAGPMSKLMGGPGSNEAGSVGMAGRQQQQQPQHHHHLMAFTLAASASPRNVVHPIYTSWCMYIACLCLHAYAESVGGAADGIQAKEEQDDSLAGLQERVETAGEEQGSSSEDPTRVLDAVGSSSLYACELFARSSLELTFASVTHLQLCVPLPEEIDPSRVQNALGLCREVSKLILEDSSWELGGCIHPMVSPSSMLTSALLCLARARNLRRAGSWDPPGRA